MPLQGRYKTEEQNPYSSLNSNTLKMLLSDYTAEHHQHTPPSPNNNNKKEKKDLENCAFNNIIFCIKE